MAGRGSAASAAGSSSAAIPVAKAKAKAHPGQFAPYNGPSMPYMTGEEIHMLQLLLRRAKETGQVGEQCMQARISGLQLAEEQRILVEDGHVHTFPSEQFPWMPRPKAKAKSAPQVPTMEFVGDATVYGAMTDASKRRFEEEEDDPGHQNALDEFELVQAMNEFNSGGGAGLTTGPAMAAGLGPYGTGEMDEIPMAGSDQVVVAPTIDTGAPVVQGAAGNRGGIHYAVQGDNALPPDQDTSWFPEVNQELQDALVTIPGTVKSPIEWGKTMCCMPKYKARRWTYEQMLRMALGGHGEVAAYLSFCLERYGPTYRLHGPRTQAADLAGYLMRYRVRIMKTPPTEGFPRELA